MELAYLPDSLLYLTGRTYNNYTESWTNINPNLNNKYNHNSKNKTDEKNCQICRDKRRKSLSNYIRRRSRRDSEPNTQLREEEENE
ncbi:UNVERIFIED_CONTAM: hypothetical protein PYX00_006309 [Menopon gallinae]|uniref:Uncharacterized protein n=1 Tax=Menopon gallinae TaxID=328185 RepID=A0AAW2HVY7_9NEOP